MGLSITAGGPAIRAEGGGVSGPLGPKFWGTLSSLVPRKSEVDRPGVAAWVAAGAVGLGLKPGSLGVVISSLKVAAGWAGRLVVISKSELTAVSVAFWLRAVGNCVWGVSVVLELWVMRDAGWGVPVRSG